MDAKTPQGGPPDKPAKSALEMLQATYDENSSEDDEDCAVGTENKEETDVTVDTESKSESGKDSKEVVKQIGNETCNEVTVCEEVNSDTRSKEIISRGEIAQSCVVESTTEDDKPPIPTKDTSSADSNVTAGVKTSTVSDKIVTQTSVISSSDVALSETESSTIDRVTELDSSEANKETTDATPDEIASSKEQTKTIDPKVQSDSVDITEVVSSQEILNNDNPVKNVKIESTARESISFEVNKQVESSVEGRIETTSTLDAVQMPQSNVDKSKSQISSANLISDSSKAEQPEMLTNTDKLDNINKDNVDSLRDNENPDSTVQSEEKNDEVPHKPLPLVSEKKTSNNVVHGKETTSNLESKSNTDKLKIIEVTPEKLQTRSSNTNENNLSSKVITSESTLLKESSTSSKEAAVEPEVESTSITDVSELKPEDTVSSQSSDDKLIVEATKADIHTEKEKLKPEPLKLITKEENTETDKLLHKKESDNDCITETVHAVNIQSSTDTSDLQKVDIPSTDKQVVESATISTPKTTVPTKLVDKKIDEESLDSGAIEISGVGSPFTDTQDTVTEVHDKPELIVAINVSDVKEETENNRGISSSNEAIDKKLPEVLSDKSVACEPIVGIEKHDVKPDKYVMEANIDVKDSSVADAQKLDSQKSFEAVKSVAGDSVIGTCISDSVKIKLSDAELISTGTPDKMTESNDTQDLKVKTNILEAQEESANNHEISSSNEPIDKKTSLTRETVADVKKCDKPDKNAILKSVDVQGSSVAEAKNSDSEKSSELYVDTSSSESISKITELDNKERKVSSETVFKKGSEIKGVVTSAHVDKVVSKDSIGAPLESGISTELTANAVKQNLPPITEKLVETKSSGNLKSRVTKSDEINVLPEVHSVQGSSEEKSDNKTNIKLSEPSSDQQSSAKNEPSDLNIQLKTKESLEQYEPPKRVKLVRPKFTPKSLVTKKPEVKKQLPIVALEKLPGSVDTKVDVTKGSFPQKESSTKVKEPSDPSIVKMPLKLKPQAIEKDVTQTEKQEPVSSVKDSQKLLTIKPEPSIVKTPSKLKPQVVEKEVTQTEKQEPISSVKDSEKLLTIKPDIKILDKEIPVVSSKQDLSQIETEAKLIIKDGHPDTSENKKITQALKEVTETVSSKGIPKVEAPLKDDVDLSVTKNDSFSMLKTPDSPKRVKLIRPLPVVKKPVEIVAQVRQVPTASDSKLLRQRLEDKQEETIKSLKRKTDDAAEGSIAKRADIIVKETVKVEPPVVTTTPKPVDVSIKDVVKSASVEPPVAKSINLSAKGETKSVFTATMSRTDQLFKQDSKVSGSMEIAVMKKSCEPSIRPKDDSKIDDSFKTSDTNDFVKTPADDTSKLSDSHVKITIKSCDSTDTTAAKFQDTPVKETIRSEEQQTLIIKSEVQETTIIQTKDQFPIKPVLDNVPVVQKKLYQPTEVKTTNVTETKPLQKVEERPVKQTKESIVTDSKHYLLQKQLMRKIEDRSEISNQNKQLEYTLKIGKDSTTMIPKDDKGASRLMQSVTEQQLTVKEKPIKVKEILRDSDVTITPIISGESSKGSKSALGKESMSFDTKPTNDSDKWKHLTDVKILPMQYNEKKAKILAHIHDRRKRIENQDGAVLTTSSGVQINLQSTPPKVLSALMSENQASSSSDDIQFVKVIPAAKEPIEDPLNISSIKQEIMMPVIPQKRRRGRPRKIPLEPRPQTMSDIQHMMMAQGHNVDEFGNSLFPVPLFDMSETMFTPGHTIFPDQIIPMGGRPQRSCRGRIKLPSVRTRRPRGSSMSGRVSSTGRGRGSGRGRGRGYKRRFTEDENIITIDNVEQEMMRNKPGRRRLSAGSRMDDETEVERKEPLTEEQKKINRIEKIKRRKEEKKQRIMEQNRLRMEAREKEKADAISAALGDEETRMSAPEGVIKEEQEGLINEILEKRKVEVEEVEAAPTPKRRRETYFCCICLEETPLRKLTSPLDHRSWTVLYEAAIVRQYEPILKLTDDFTKEIPGTVLYHRNCRSEFTHKKTLAKLAESTVSELNLSELDTTTDNAGSSNKDKEFSVDQMAEYQWPIQGGELCMIQEQISTYLGVKSFKRKYPDIKRRSVEMEERQFLCDNSLVSESLCDLGLTAVNSAEVLDIMFADFPEKYEEFRKHIREKQAREVSSKQKAALCSLLDKKKIEQKQSKQETKQEAIQSAASWNSNLNKMRKEERRCSLDLQSLIVHYPSNRRKKMCPITEPQPVSNYPVALIPGQFSDFYKKYTPDELRYFPLDTVLYGPILPNERHGGGSDASQSDTDDSSSSDDSSDTSSEGTQDTEGTCEEDDKEREKEKQMEEAHCKVCGGDKTRNKQDQPEVMVHCAQCTKSCQSNFIKIIKQCSVKLFDAADE